MSIPVLFATHDSNLTLGLNPSDSWRQGKEAGKSSREETTVERVADGPANVRTSTQRGMERRIPFAGRLREAKRGYDELS